MLTFPIKEKWFRMIEQGIKKEEYREITDYYKSRLYPHMGNLIQVCFRNGYKADSPKIYCHVIVLYGKTGNPEWGAEPGKKYFVLSIESVRHEP